MLILDSKNIEIWTFMVMFAYKFIPKRQFWSNDDENIDILIYYVK